MHADDEALFAGAHYAYLDAKFIRLVRLAFGDALDFRRMHTVHLAFVVALLGMNTPGNFQQCVSLADFLFSLLLPSPALRSMSRITLPR